MEKPLVYIVDDESSIRKNLSFGLSFKYRVEAFASAEEARPALTSAPPDAVLLDLSLPGQNGLDFLVVIRNKWPTVPVIIITATSELPVAIEAMKRGAQNYLTKPLQLDALKMAVARALTDSKVKTDLDSFQALAL